MDITVSHGDSEKDALDQCMVCVCPICLQTSVWCVSSQYESWGLMFQRQVTRPGPVIPLSWQLHTCLCVWSHCTTCSHSFIIKRGRQAAGEERGRRGEWGHASVITLALCIGELHNFLLSLCWDIQKQCCTQVVMVRCSVKVSPALVLCPFKGSLGYDQLKGGKPSGLGALLQSQWLTSIAVCFVSLGRWQTLVRDVWDTATVYGKAHCWITDRVPSRGVSIKRLAGF